MQPNSDAVPAATARSGREPLPLMPKSEVAGRIVDKIESLLK